ncbi:MAG: hypothetical protein AAFS10_11255, partial [Myxococcota bacterium]
MMSLNTWTTTTTVITSILALLATGCGGDISPDGSTLDGEEVSEVSKQEAATQRRTAALEEAPSSV